MLYHVFLRSQYNLITNIIEICITSNFYIICILLYKYLLFCTVLSNLPLLVVIKHAVIREDVPLVYVATKTTVKQPSSASKCVQKRHSAPRETAVCRKSPVHRLFATNSILLRLHLESESAFKDEGCLKD